MRSDKSISAHSDLIPFVSIVIPVFNEAKRIYNLNEILDYCKDNIPDYEIVVVDDGSVDDTVNLASEILKRCPKNKILISDKNYGKGHAVAKGMTASKGQLKVFLDIDLATPIKYLKPAIVELDNSDIIIATRKNGMAVLIKRQSFVRENLGKCFTFVSQIILNTWVSDFTCGFKLFRASAADRIFSLSKVNRWAFDSEVLFLARKMNYRVKEMPVEWTNDSDTRVNIVQVIIPTLFELIQIRFRKYPNSNSS
ncbi:MAG: glycosyltransferase [Patescibacteria group bacterium]